jgi:hypothetical protein
LPIEGQRFRHADAAPPFRAAEREVVMEQVDRGPGQIGIAMSIVFGIEGR